MSMNPSPDRPRSSNALAKARDARILWLLERHPATAGMLVEIGFFRSKSRASKRLRRIVSRKRVRLAGTVALREGRPEHVYCRGSRVKGDNLLHEVYLSRLCFRMHADTVRRGLEEVDRYLRPDAELVIGGRRFLLEFDRGTMSYEEIVHRRFSRYRSCNDLVLWVCSTDTRMEGLRRRSEAIREVALFTSLEAALRDPHAPIWIDFDGAKVALPKGREVAPKGSRKGGHKS
jgi:hypothetical protein